MFIAGMSLTAPTVEDIVAARARIRDRVLRTPLVRLASPSDGREIYLKLENLQPTGSFKMRAAGSAMTAASPGDLGNGVYTASAGNMAQGVAWNARALGLPARIIVPDHAPANKLQAIAALGGTVVKLPFDAWWEVLVSNGSPTEHGFFIHPVCNREVIAGNGTIGLEIVEDLPEVDTIIVPYGGGALSTGIAIAVNAQRPQAKVFACEVETAAPLAASLAAGAPVTVNYQATFVDGMGSRSILPAMWPLVSKALAGSLVVTLRQIERAVRQLFLSHRVVAEGAGAAALAAALAHADIGRRVVCVVSGGNINIETLAAIVSAQE
ncbi:MAG TPA: pyridoxal-phosphate dependent enzyme [Polyangiaceae bacterium]|jgi:threonine dehydratase|nr:pyridoxal-phosphate dependent enzyme [Polyangiaceae bacterium]